MGKSRKFKIFKNTNKKVNVITNNKRIVGEIKKNDITIPIYGSNNDKKDNEIITIFERNKNSNNNNINLFDNNENNNENSKNNWNGKSTLPDYSKYQSIVYFSNDE